MKHIFLYTLFLILSLFCLGETPCVYADASMTPQSASTPQEDPLLSPFKSLEENPTVSLSYKGAFAKMMFSLFALIALILLCAWILRKMATGRLRQINQGKAIKILERRPISQKSVLYLLEVSGKKVLMAESQAEVRTLMTVDIVSSSDPIADEE